jgi:hypothetical protein
MADGLLLCGLLTLHKLLRESSLPDPDEAIVFETARGGNSVTGVPENTV